MICKLHLTFAKPVQFLSSFRWSHYKGIDGIKLKKKHKKTITIFEFNLTLIRRLRIFARSLTQSKESAKAIADAPVRVPKTLVLCFYVFFNKAMLSQVISWG